MTAEQAETLILDNRMEELTRSLFSALTESAKIEGAAKCR